MTTFAVPQLFAKGIAPAPKLAAVPLQSTYYEMVRDHLSALLEDLELPIVRALDTGFEKVGPGMSRVRTVEFNEGDSQYELDPYSQGCVAGRRRVQIWTLIVEAREWVAFEPLENLLLSRKGMEVVPSPGSDLEKRFLLLKDSRPQHPPKEERSTGSRNSYTLHLVNPQDAFAN